MRMAWVAVLLAATLPASAQEPSLRIRSARPFGYFVGDLIHARIDVVAPADAALSRASLPHPGPLTSWLDLRDVAFRQTTGDGKQLWRLDLTYQNFYVALDAREMEIPGFNLAFSTAAGTQEITIPAWSVGVSPLREISPKRQERGADYLRPDGAAAFVDEARPRNLAMGAGAGALLALALVARDRAWPPFRQRKQRVFSALASRFVSRRDSGVSDLGAAIQSVHRALDIANGAILLSDDLPGFLQRHAEFQPLRADFEWFFTTSKRRFFGGGIADEDLAAARLTKFVRALAKQERAG